MADPDAVAVKLLNEGLWTGEEDGRLRVCQAHDDLRRADGRGDEQPSKAFVDKERDRARERKETWKTRNGGRNAVPNGVRNSPQSSAEQSSAVQDPKGPLPAPGAGSAGPAADAPDSRAPIFERACEHGFPGGQLQTKAGTPRCPACRHMQVTA